MYPRVRPEYRVVHPQGGTRWVRDGVLRHPTHHPETAIRARIGVIHLFQDEMSGRSGRLGVVGDRAAISKALAEMSEALTGQAAEFTSIERSGREILLPIARLRARK